MARSHTYTLCASRGPRPVTLQVAQDFLRHPERSRDFAYRGRYHKQPGALQREAGHAASEVGMTDYRIREARDSDAEGLIALICGCWSEYPGCVLDVDGECPELRQIATYFGRMGGQFWVAEQEGRIVGSAGCLPTGNTLIWQLRRLYVAPSVRRKGLGTALTRLAEGHAKDRGARYAEFWSDTRFTDAHRLYEQLGYERASGTRLLPDISRSYEYYFRKALTG
jgi:GNAT superfamily N-acetyltransferase